MTGDIFAVDPGGVTGVAWKHPDSTFIYASEVPGGFDGFAEYIQDSLTLFTGATVLVENFLITPQTHKKDAGAFRDTNDIIGLCRYLAFRAESPFVLQTPTQAKTVGTDDNLRALDAYTPTAGGHANDAIRHVVTYLVKSRDPYTLSALARADS